MGVPTSSQDDGGIVAPPSSSEAPPPSVLPVEDKLLCTFTVSCFSSGRVSLEGKGLESLNQRRQSLVSREMIRAHHVAAHAALVAVEKNRGK